MQQELKVKIQVEIVPFGTFIYRFTEAIKNDLEDRPKTANEMPQAPYYLPSATGDLHGPVVMRSAAG